LERLLDPNVPLRFIFSHSALREGWDSPNVFQICTLNETQSMEKKRQEIGRGLRLPVNETGERVHDETVNRLTVIANESYEDFARSLQTEFEEDFGIKFGRVDKIAFAKLVRRAGEAEIGTNAAYPAIITSAGLWDSSPTIVFDVPMLARSEIADATSVGPSKAAIVLDVVMACPIGFRYSFA